MAHSARSRGGPTRKRPPSGPPRQHEPGRPPRADRRTRPGWPSLCRNASDALLAFDDLRGGDRVLDPAIEDQICAVGGDGSIGDDHGTGELADAKISHGIDTGSENLGGYADHQPIDQPDL